MSNYVILTVIPNMYHCESCKELIKSRIAIGVRKNNKNKYYHNSIRCIEIEINLVNA